MYRIIYSLQLDLSPGPTGELRQLIVPLGRDGNAQYVEHEERERRAIDLRDGDHFFFQGQREKAVRIRAYRDHFIEHHPGGVNDGYAYRVLDRKKPHRLT